MCYLQLISPWVPVKRGLWLNLSLMWLNFMWWVIPSNCSGIIMEYQVGRDLKDYLVQPLNWAIQVVHGVSAVIWASRFSQDIDGSLMSLWNQDTLPGTTWSALAAGTHLVQTLIAAAHTPPCCVLLTWFLFLTVFCKWQNILIMSVSFSKSA